MIKAIIAVVAVLAAFAVGMAGVYYTMPTLAPDKVEKAQMHLDSLTLVDSLTWAYNQGAMPDSSVFAPDSLAVELAPSDTAAVTEATPDEVEAQEADSTEEAAAEMLEQTELQDSLVIFQEQFEQLQREQQQLLEEIKALKKQVADQAAHAVEIEELSGTLAKLEDKELAGVVERLDMGVLQVLYEKASARNRKRLLQAMPPDAAAGFVRRLVQPEKNTVAVTAPADTVAAMPASSSEPGSLN